MHTVSYVISYNYKVLKLDVLIMLYEFEFLHIPLCGVNISGKIKTVKKYITLRRM